VLGLVDEMFKGTNVMDAHDATELVVSRLARCAKSVFMVSSHLVELADRLAPIASVRFVHFDATIDDGRLLFSYELKPGVSRQRLGMVLLEREGVARSLENVERTQAI
jgi:DNA mismatch repair ATPase MutS